MKRAIERLKTYYFFSLGLQCLLNFGMIAGIFFLGSGILDSESNIVKYGLIGLLCLCELFFLIEFIICFSDFKSVCRNDFEILTGQILCFQENMTETGKQLNNLPIVYDPKTKRRIKLLLNREMDHCKICSVLYLRHTKIGVPFQDPPDPGNL